MPTPARTSLDDIIRAGCDILEAEGQAGLTMNVVAARVGVRGPSLYKRVRSRDDLIRLIATRTARDLGDHLDTIVRGTAGPTDARTQLTDLAHMLRAFAHARPEQYRLVFAPGSEATQPDAEARARAVAPLLDVTTRLAGPEHALEAARTVTAWASGFIGMELAGAFQLGGDVDRAYEFGIVTLAAALAHRAGEHSTE
ncbi:TetR/AcrR family transcriptional regulator [Microbacterium invictum]|uniref:AcrR family transcriptional regulator n=1 Tax=Microbacterium invictum TaxID=515415 RepID=A0AA40SQQ9_9MICO|nr:TetR-like C-terminal domain-containing protein [Microbacterium invictum]MBB4140505.1 AcrR family transcriptional regulator [Microbacterium invictum]